MSTYHFSTVGQICLVPLMFLYRLTFQSLHHLGSSPLTFLQFVTLLLNCAAQKFMHFSKWGLTRTEWNNCFQWSWLYTPLMNSKLPFVFLALCHTADSCLIWAWQRHSDTLDMCYCSSPCILCLSFVYIIFVLLSVKSPPPIHFSLQVVLRLE